VPVLPLISKRKTTSILETAKEGPNAKELSSGHPSVVKKKKMAIHPTSVTLAYNTSTQPMKLADCLFVDYAGYSWILFFSLSTTSNLGQSDNQPNASKRSLRHLLLVYVTMTLQNLECFGSTEIVIIWTLHVFVFLGHSQCRLYYRV